MRIQSEQKPGPVLLAYKALALPPLVLSPVLNGSLKLVG